MTEIGSKSWLDAIESEKRDRALNACRDLRKCLGYVENGTDQTVVISQDDATGSWVVKAGKTSHYGESLENALSEAAAAIPDEES